jgi:hypothetical protein
MNVFLRAVIYLELQLDLDNDGVMICPACDIINSEQIALFGS